MQHQSQIEHAASILDRHFAYAVPNPSLLRYHRTIAADLVLALEARPSDPAGALKTILDNTFDPSGRAQMDAFHAHIAADVVKAIG